MTSILKKHSAILSKGDASFNIDPFLVQQGLLKSTSGKQKKELSFSKNTLQKMIEYANGRIEIMTGGGVNPTNVKKIIDNIKPDAVHFSGTENVLIDEDSLFSESVLKASESKIKNILKEANR